MSKIFQVDTQQNLTQNLSAYYQLWTNGLDFYNSFNLTNNNSVTFSANGRVNGAANFSGNNYLSILNSGNTMFGGGVSLLNWSISFWMYLTASNGGCILSFNRQPPISIYRAFRLGGAGGSGNGNNLTGRFATSGQYEVYKQGITQNGWNHVVLTKDSTVGGNFKVYWNGNLVATTARDWSPGDTDTNFYIGGMPIAGDYIFNLHRICEFGIWKRVLSTANVTDLYNGGNGQTMFDYVVQQNNMFFYFDRDITNIAKNAKNIFELDDDILGKFGNILG